MSALYERPGAGGPFTPYIDPRLKGSVVRCSEHGAHLVTPAGRIRRLDPQ